jgi:hypothetical protein
VFENGAEGNIWIWRMEIRRWTKLFTYIILIAKPEGKRPLQYINCKI